MNLLGRGNDDFDNINNNDNYDNYISNIIAVIIINNKYCNEPIGSLQYCYTNQII